MPDYTSIGDIESRLARAILDLTTEKGLHELSPIFLAKVADIPIATVRAFLPKPEATLSLILRWVDNEALTRFESADHETLTVRERLFDLLVTRMEILQPYKNAIEMMLTPYHVVYSSRSHIQALGGSIAWILMAAGIRNGGSFFHRVAAGVVMADITRIWLADQDPHMSHFIARLDRYLARLEKIALRVDRFSCRKKTESRALDPSSHEEEETPYKEATTQIIQD